jgi:multidrug resistance efflux pump
VVEAKETPAAAQPSAAETRQIRATGMIQAVNSFSVQVPRITAATPNASVNRITLVRLVPNGTRVKEGDVLAEFDRTEQLDAAREAQAKAEDLAEQVKQKEAKNNSDREERISDIKQAEADLAKAEIQLRKGPILSEIDKLKNEAKARSARERLESLKKIDKYRVEAEASALRILQLQQERQMVALDRARTNAEKLVVKARLSGMVALENIWRGGSMGQAQEGDQLFPGQQLLKIFDPRTMYVRTLVGEPDGSVLTEGVTATVTLDAYPDAVFKARFDGASPVATAAIGSPIKNFTAIFRLDASDLRLLPDLSAAVVIHPHPEAQRP